MNFDVSQYEGQGVSRDALDQYLAYLRQHIAYVREAGRWLQVPEPQLIVHDASKFWAEEFVPYARHFYGDAADPLGYEMAWLHHQNTNRHHWEFYISRSPDPQPQYIVHEGCLPMPHAYVLEMVADWMGASRVLTGSWEIGEWYQQNKQRMRVHPTTRILLQKTLESIRYGAAYRPAAA